MFKCLWACGPYLHIVLVSLRGIHKGWCRAWYCWQSESVQKTRTEFRHTKGWMGWAGHHYPGSLIILIGTKTVRFPNAVPNHHFSYYKVFFIIKYFSYYKVSIHVYLYTSRYDITSGVSCCKYGSRVFFLKNILKKNTTAPMPPLQWQQSPKSTSGTGSVTSTTHK